MTTIAAGVLLGLAGSAHCLVMCGPLVSVLRPHGVHAVLYHGARTVSYATVGAIAGSAGALIAAAGVGRWLTMAGAAVLVALAWRQWQRAPARAGAPGPLSAFVIRALARGARWSRTHPSAAPVVLGTLHGWLPCGLVYAAVVAAAAHGDATAGAAFMAGFGVATTPILLVAAVSFDAVRARLSPRVKSLAPVALLLVALLLAVRGLASLSAHLH